jgi:GT2 family glycosyltransferase
MEIAVLLTCHNRKEKTITCLDSLFNADLPYNYSLKVFLVDDGSIDGTSQAIKDRFSEVNIIQGNGALYWNRGMRLAWETALMYRNDYDYYLWLNDDTFINKDAIIEVLNVAHESCLSNDIKPIVTGAFYESKENMIFSYGGRMNDEPVVPNGKLQKCSRINGNFVLIPYEVYKKLGILSGKYTHGMGDFDYSARAEKMGIPCYTTRSYIGFCATNKKISSWCDPKKSFIERWKNFNSPLGLNIREYKEFLKVHSLSWKRDITKAYLKFLLPKLYVKISNIF